MKQIEGQMSIFDFLDNSKPTMQQSEITIADEEYCSKEAECHYWNEDHCTYGVPADKYSCIMGKKVIPRVKRKWQLDTPTDKELALQQDVKVQAGDWVKEHGARVFFEDIEPNNYYIADYSTASHKFFKVVYVIEKKDGDIHYVDSERGVIDKKWSWGNSYSALTRRQYINADENKDQAEGGTNGWWYQIAN